ncbi:TPA: helix-turn-helix domain-containing protein [Salmonella enterica subsp. enterica serovar Eastbourne]
MSMMSYNAGFIAETVNWIEQNLRTIPGCPALAGRTGYSLRHIQRKFTALTGMPVVSYIRCRRLTRAAVALRLTRRPVGSIAGEWGYSSHHTFTRAFTRHFGVSPDRYRQMNSWMPEKLTPRLCAPGR